VRVNDWKSIARRTRDWALDRRLLRYRPERHHDGHFAHGHSSGAFEYYADLDELPRYSVLLGYLTFFGGAPDIVDVGCGRGLLRARLAPEQFSRYVGIDLAAPAIDAARHLENGRTRFVLGDAATLDLPDSDVVVLNEVLYYFDDAGAVLDRVSRCLRPGGRVLTSMWRHPGDRQLWHMVDAHFQLLDRVEVRSERNRLARRGWLMACHARG
jgi:2-polyprenyl-6-hydroxyphenyl methylase/3-demethylubiquinone-9 3-methyltransferase